MGKTFDPAKPEDYLGELQDQEVVVRESVSLLGRVVARAKCARYRRRRDLT